MLTKVTSKLISDKIIILYTYIKEEKVQEPPKPQKFLIIQSGERERERKRERDIYRKREKDRD